MSPPKGTSTQRAKLRDHEGDASKLERRGKHCYQSGYPSAPVEQSAGYRRNMPATYGTGCDSIRTTSSKGSEVVEIAPM